MANDFVKDTYIYSTFDVAMYMVGLLNEKRISLDVLKVQTLLYITYGVYLCAYDERLLNEHPQVYYRCPLFSQLREDMIQMDLYSVTMDSNRVAEDELKKIKGDPKLNDVLEFVIYHFAELPSNELCDLVRDKDSAWAMARNREDFRWGDYISDEDIRKRYSLEYAVYMSGC